MQAIKNAYVTRKINLVTAAKRLTHHNGNPLAGNVKIVQNWKREA